MAHRPSPTRWQAIERHYHAALELPPDHREPFLDGACAGDEDMKNEVRALLQHDPDAESFLDRLALASVVQSSAAELLSPGSSVAGYEITAFLGSGGMGDVYQAREVRLGREVALKILDHGAADPAWMARFEEEARAASGLTHPNIVTIYSVGDDRGLAFIAMELVRGRTLREMHAEIPLAMAADLACQLAEALSAAHPAGIVHRDLKPDNLMVTEDGRLKVLDFGIAKRRGADEWPAGGIVGTVGYMSPEQANGEPVDHRSDHFAFGAILYEMLCGHRAFAGSTDVDTLDAIRTAQPDLVRLGVRVPAKLLTIVARCLSRLPHDRYADSAELARAMREVRTDLTRQAQDGGITRRRAILIGGAALVTLATPIAWASWPRGSGLRSLIVLPFDNPDNNPAIEYLCAGIAESLIRRLAFVPDIEVAPLTAAAQVRSRRLPPGAAARRLNADAVLTGSVRVKDGQISVDSRLVSAGEASTLWKATYERRAADLLQLQQELARAIVADGVRRPLPTQAQRRFDRELTVDAEAQDLFLRGIHAHRQGGELNYRAARRLLQRAVDRDPTFALALVSLASTYSVLTIDGFERPTSAWPESNRCVRRALDIDPGLPEGHAEQASSWFFFDHDWAAAEREWNRAIHGEPSPALPDLLHASAVKLWALNRTSDALTMIAQARQLDPLTPSLAVQEAHLLRHAGRLQDAARAYSSILAEAPGENAALFGLAETLRAQGEFGEAISALERAHTADSASAPLPFASAFKGARGEQGYRSIEQTAARAQLAVLATARTQNGYVSPLDLARAHALAGNADQAFGYLDDAFEENSPGLVFLNVDAAWTPLRNDSRLQAVVQALRLPS